MPQSYDPIQKLLYFRYNHLYSYTNNVIGTKLWQIISDICISFAEATFYINMLIHDGSAMRLLLVLSNLHEVFQMIDLQN